MVVRSVSFLWWVLGPVVAQDLFERNSKFLAQYGVANATSGLSSRDPPQKDDQIGCGNSCDSGDDFDHFNDMGLNGAISKICFTVGKFKPIHHKDWIVGGMFCYAGNCVSQGTGADEDDCFSLTSDEAIAELTGTSGCTPHGAKHWGVSSITIKTTNQRTHKWGGRECGNTYALKPPTGKHITAFYGRASSRGLMDKRGLFSKIGVYYDVGIASGRWVQIAGGPGVVPGEWKYSSCTTSSSSSSVSTTSAWSISASAEMSFGFEFEGAKEGNKRSITGTMSHSITHGSQSSFETKECVDVPMSCVDGLNYAFQFQFKSNFDGSGNAVTKSNHWVCHNAHEVCCLPSFFNDDTDASKGCKDGSPNVCE